MDWIPALVAVVVLGAWIGLVRFVFPRFGIKGGWGSPTARSREEPPKAAETRRP